MRLLILTSLFIGIFSFSQAQIGKQFPSMEGESLTNKMIDIPNDLKGKYSIIGLAYSKKSEDALKTWFEPAYYQFIYKPETPSLFAGNYDVNVYFVPMFTGAKRPAYKAVMKKVKKTIDERLLPYVLFYKGELKKYKKELGFKGKDVPYFFIIDENGKIIHSTSGRYTDAKMSEITDYIEDSWK